MPHPIPLFAALLLVLGSAVARAATPTLTVTDADNHQLVLNAPGAVSVILGTSPDSQDAARRASLAMNPFQGRPGFRYIVTVDLRSSIAAWVPSIVIRRMQRSLDGQAAELKPYYLRNGNTQDPRPHCYLVPDFRGTVLPQLKWGGRSDQLHAIVYGPNGRELARWDNLTDLTKLQAVVRTALGRLAHP
ncbi:MAG: hypothetical protein WDO13_21250 [Verrucomicrobiota bacterium]